MSARKDEDMLGTTFASCFSAFVERSPMFLQSSYVSAIINIDWRIDIWLYPIITIAG
jgi:hypothetical protein